MSDKPSIRWSPDGNYFVEHVCATCGDKYFIHAAANSIADTGRCVSCDKEIADLEAMFNPAVTS